VRLAFLVFIGLYLLAAALALGSQERAAAAY
jgi:hypothetical protein